MDYYKSKIILLIDANDFLGEWFVKILASYGAKVIFCVDRLEEGIRIEEDIRSIGFKAESIVVSQVGTDGIDALVEKTANRYGRIDILFNHQWSHQIGHFRETSLSEWYENFDLNIRNVVDATHAAYPLMIRQGFGQIVNTASLAGISPSPGASSFAAAKHAIVGLTSSLRLEAEKYDIKINVLCPDLSHFLSQPKSFIKKSTLDNFQVDALTVEVEEALVAISKNRSIVLMPKGHMFSLTNYSLLPDMLGDFSKKWLNHINRFRLETN